MTAYWIHDTPGKPCVSNKIWMGLTDRWDLDEWKRCLWEGGNGILVLEKSRIWVLGGSIVLVLDGSEDALPEVRRHRCGSYWEDVTLVRDTGRVSRGLRDVLSLSHLQWLLHSPLSWLQTFGNEINICLYWLYFETFIHICTSLGWE